MHSTTQSTFVTILYDSFSGKKLDRLVAEGIIKPVQFADWAVPVVFVLNQYKASGRTCGDFKPIANQVSKLDYYPVPKLKTYLQNWWMANSSHTLI